MAAAVVLLTGAFLTTLFRDLPAATLAAIVVVAIAGFFRIDELRRFWRIRRTAFVLASTALVGVLLLGVLPGLLVAVLLSLVILVRRLSRPPVVTLVRDPRTGAWGRPERHADGRAPEGVLVTGIEGPLLYTNATVVKERLLELAREADPGPAALVLDLEGNHELDLQAVDTLGELADELAADGVELRLVAPHAGTVAELRRSGVADRLVVAPTFDAAVGEPAQGRRREA